MISNFHILKNWGCTLLGLVLLYSCNHDDPKMPDPCLPYVSNPGWTEQVFHEGTFIQFPDNYIGGRGGIEGPIFSKYRMDTLVFMWYAFCGALFCDDYGESLENPDTTFVRARTYSFGLDSITLTKRKEICDDLLTLGIYFYKDSIRDIGKLYWYTDHAFKEALTIEYDPSRQDEVEHVLQTIH